MENVMSKFVLTEEWEGIKLGDVYEEHGVPHKVLFIGNPNEPYPILCTKMDGTHMFYNEAMLKANMKLVERDGQEVVEESNLRYDPYEDQVYEIVYMEKDQTVVRMYIVGDNTLLEVVANSWLSSLEHVHL